MNIRTELFISHYDMMHIPTKEAFKEYVATKWKEKGVVMKPGDTITEIASPVHCGVLLIHESK